MSTAVSGNWFSVATIAGKLKLMASVSALILISLSAYLVQHEYRVTQDNRELAVRQNVETLHSVINWAYSLETAGTHTRQQAQQVAMAIVNQARYAENEYFWIFNEQGRILEHPVSPKLIGQDASQFKDPNGKFFVREMLDQLRQQGSGTVAYKWAKPGVAEPVDKIAYVQGFKAWGWAISSGVYTDDLRAAFLAKMGQVVVVVALALAINVWMVRRVYQPLSKGLNKAIRVARAIAQRDLTQRITVKGNDEISALLDAMRSMSDDLKHTLHNVRDTTHQLAQASEQIASGNQDLSNRTENTASNLQETASSMEQLTSSVAQNAEAARQAAQLANTASQVAQAGGEAVSQVVTTMQGISQASRRISDIIGVIDGIAFQTNILALNAAVEAAFAAKIQQQFGVTAGTGFQTLLQAVNHPVEAARAGEQGRGFAVVAGEVRTLAQRSAQAAQEIKTLIQASVEQVGTGASQVENAGSTIDRVVESVQQVNELIQQITHANHQQSQGIAQVHSAITELDRMTQQNAALVEESASAAASLSDQAQQLSSNVDRFKFG